MMARSERKSHKPIRFTVGKKLTQAFKQAPWRNQIRYAGVFLLILVVILLVASIYLSISGRAAAAGLSTYRMSLERQNIEREIADLKAQIAIQTSVTVMEQRAKDLGFKRITPDEAIYMIIPNYTGKQTVVLAAPPGIADAEPSIVLPAYRQSLWDWLFLGINRLSASAGGGL